MYDFWKKCKKYYKYIWRIKISCFNKECKTNTPKRYHAGKITFSTITHIISLKIPHTLCQEIFLNGFYYIVYFFNDTICSLN